MNSRWGRLDRAYRDLITHLPRLLSWRRSTELRFAIQALNIHRTLSSQLIFFHSEHSFLKRPHGVPSQVDIRSDGKCQNSYIWLHPTHTHSSLFDDSSPIHSSKACFYFQVQHRCTAMWNDISFSRLTNPAIRATSTTCEGKTRTSYLRGRTLGCNDLHLP
ncbi:hypothetical protein CPB84DRAFT_529573 [Gymnopilus junonius]|uniref:Uncharacterized protein n=1 Tax=Gymnopilus junonius TaxID=109634 RepID=A0A9P5P1F5_GYMJU|nr:hypothetical protein CPB84DRAFT_529573 [Gymnopilus junonius]